MNASSLKDFDGRQCGELIPRTNERKRCESQIIILDSPSNSQKLSSASSWACHASNACLSSSLNKIHTKNLILSFPRKVCSRNYTFHAPQSQSSARNTNILFYFIIFFFNCATDFAHRGLLLVYKKLSNPGRYQRKEEGI